MNSQMTAELLYISVQHWNSDVLFYRKVSAWSCVTAQRWSLHATQLFALQHLLMQIMAHCCTTLPHFPNSAAWCEIPRAAENREHYRLLRSQ